MSKKKRLLYRYDEDHEDFEPPTWAIDNHPYPETRKGLARRFRYWRGVNSEVLAHIPWKGRTWVFKDGGTAVFFYPKGIPGDKV